MKVYGLFSSSRQSGDILIDVFDTPQAAMKNQPGKWTYNSVFNTWKTKIQFNFYTVEELKVRS